MRIPAILTWPVDSSKGGQVKSLVELRRAEVEIGGMLPVDGLSPPDTPTSQGHIEAVPQPR